MPEKISVVIERDEEGFFAFCPDMPGCHSQGETFEEACTNIREAAELYLETLDDDERRACLSREVISVSMEVASVT
jgi:predicted RNase H-like HicB family nuclease